MVRFEDNRTYLDVITVYGASNQFNVTDCRSFDTVDPKSSSNHIQQ